jgi:hypothetical protein
MHSLLALRFEWIAHSGSSQGLWECSGGAREVCYGGEKNLCQRKALLPPLCLPWIPPGWLWTPPLPSSAELGKNKHGVTTDMVVSCVNLGNMGIWNETGMSPCSHTGISQTLPPPWLLLWTTHPQSEELSRAGCQ